MSELADRIDSSRPDDGPPPPKRRYRLVLDLQADDVAGLIHTLDHLSYDLMCGQFSTTHHVIAARTSGTDDAGYHVEVIDHGEDITHEVYAQALAAWLADKGTDRD